MTTKRIISGIVSAAIAFSMMTGITSTGDHGILETTAVTADAAARYAFFYPVEDAKVTSGYGIVRTFNGKKDVHTGIDFVSTSGKLACYAVADGEIVWVEQRSNKNVPDWNLGFANTIVLKLKDGSIAIYAHLAPNSFKVKKGDKVKAGQQLATIGKTGAATGVHLHFELRPAKYSDLSKGIYHFYGKKYTLNVNNNQDVTYKKLTPGGNGGNSNVTYFKKYTGKSCSIVDALSSLGYESSFSYRSKIYTKNSLKGKFGEYRGSSAQNLEMLSRLKQGKLIKP